MQNEQPKQTAQTAQPKQTELKSETLTGFYPHQPTQEELKTTCLTIRRAIGYYEHEFESMDKTFLDDDGYWMNFEEYAETLEAPHPLLTLLDALAVFAVVTEGEPGTYFSL